MLVGIAGNLIYILKKKYFDQTYFGKHYLVILYNLVCMLRNFILRLEFIGKFNLVNT